MPLYKNDAKTSLATIDIDRLLSSSVLGVGEEKKEVPFSQFLSTEDHPEYTILLFVRNGAWIACEVQLAAYRRIYHLLERHHISLVVVLTSSVDFYTQRFSSSLGFDVRGTIVLDEAKQTHAAVGLKSSVWASLVLPFRYHLRVFGLRALWEALRVSLQHATKGRGSSWQQGGTFVLKKRDQDIIQPTLAWREEYPGDWMSLRDILEQGAQLPLDDDDDELDMDWRDVLEFVIESRKRHEKEGKTKKERANDTNSKDTTNTCGALACDLDHLKKGLGQDP